MSDLQQKMRAYIVQNVLFGQADGLGDNDSFIESGLIDSTGVLELVSYLEEEYSITVAEEEITPENLDSIAKLVEFMTRKLAHLSVLSSSTAASTVQ